MLIPYLPTVRYLVQYHLIDFIQLYIAKGLARIFHFDILFELRQYDIQRSCSQDFSIDDAPCIELIRLHVSSRYRTRS